MFRKKGIHTPSSKLSFVWHVPYGIASSFAPAISLTVLSAMFPRSRVGTLPREFLLLQRHFRGLSCGDPLFAWYVGLGFRKRRLTAEYLIMGLFIVRWHCRAQVGSEG